MTALYVPPTDEADHKKQNQSIQLIGGITSTNTANITSNTSSIATNTANIATNTTNIASNTASIATLQAAGFLGFGIGTYVANADLSTLIPADDTIPQNTEGTQIISVSYTPKSSTSTLTCSFTGQVTSTGADNVTAALFNGAANAFAAEMVNVSGANIKVPFALTGSYAPGSTSAQTITVRVGGGGATARLNGTSVGRVLGGASVATLIIYEIK